MSPPKQPTHRKLLRRPLRSPAEAERLAALVAERRAVLRERGRLALVAAAAVVVLAVFILATDPDAGGSDVWILPPMLVLAAAIATPFVLRRRWADPRLLTAQRRLLADRGLAANALEEPEVVLEDLEQRIERAAALLHREAEP